MSTDTPVLIIAFQRKADVERIIDRCISSGIRNIYLAIDGPKNDVQARTQRQIVSFAKERAIECPPSTVSTCPVIQDDSSVARKSAVDA